MRPLKIWLPSLNAGSGASVFVLRLAHALEKQGHEPVVQWFNRWFEPAPWLLGRTKPPAGTDIIHVNSWHGFAFRQPGTPLVVTEHHYVDAPSFRPLTTPAQRAYHRLLISRFTRWSYAAADAVTTVSHFCASEMVGALPSPAHVIPNWIDTDEFSPLPRTPRAGPFRLLFVGNPSPRKGADILPSLAEQLGPDFEIICMGGLRKGFREDSLPANMRLAPSVPVQEMPSIYRAADAALVPTRFETFGYVAAEAMACGLPVIGFNRAGTAEICRQDETALLVPGDDMEALAHQARRLAADPALAERLGRAGRQRILEHYSERRSVAAYIDLYRQLLAAREPGPQGQARPDQSRQ